jgi:hypothetical protein
MTTQQAPHTPLWRRFLSLPHTRLGRWAIGLSAGSGLLLIFGLFLNAFVGLGVSPWVWVILIAGVLAGAVIGLIALLRSPQHAPPIPLSRRVLFVWLAMAPIALMAAVPIAFMAMFMRHEVRYDLSIVSTVLPLVGMTAGVAALHFVQRGSERYGLGGTIYSAASLIGVALIVVGILIGRVSQDWLVGTNLMGVGLWAATIGLTALAIITLYARVVPWWGGAALLVANPLGVAILSNLLVSFIPESHNAHAATEKLARVFDLTGSAEQWLDVAWGVAWGVVPWVVVGFAVFLAARRLTERPARVR